MTTTSLRRRFLCRVLRRHRWQSHSTEDGRRYSTCVFCHTDSSGILDRTSLLRGW